MSVRLAMPRSSAASVVRSIGLVLLLILTTFILGALTALAPPLAAALGVFMLALIFGFVLPLPWLFVVTLFSSAIFAGTIEYFLSIAQANWIPFILSLLLAVRVVVEKNIGSKPRAFSTQVVASTDALRRHPAAGLVIFVYPVVLYIAVIVASAAANAIPGPQAFAAFKNYLMMWGILVAIWSMDNFERTSTWIWRSMVVISMLQLPVVIYQRIFIAGRLSNTASSLSFDAISGTFGGGLSGGRSGALAMFICIALAYLLVLWRERRISSLRLTGYALLMLPTLFIVEVKAVIFWLPAVAFIVFLAQIRRRPLLFVAGVAGSVITVFAVILVYRYSYYAPSGDQSLESFFSRDLAYMWDPGRYNPATRELGRVSVLVHWWNENHFGDLAHWLFGFGPGASRGISSVAVGSVAAKYPFFIDISAAAMLLWDVGMVGFMSFCLIMVVGVLEAWRVKRSPLLNQTLRIEVEAAMIALLLLLSSVIYTRDVVDGTTTQFLLFFCLGVVVHGKRALQKALVTTGAAPSSLSSALSSKGSSGRRTTLVTGKTWRL